MIRGNTLPALTWRWMDVNDVEIKLKNKDIIPYTALDGVGKIDK